VAVRGDDNGAVAASQGEAEQLVEGRAFAGVRATGQQQVTRLAGQRHRHASNLDLLLRLVPGHARQVFTADETCATQEAHAAVCVVQLIEQPQRRERWRKSLQR